MIDDGGNAEEGRCATVILKMPEEESEDQADAEAHKPSYEEERSTLQVLELFQHGHPFWDLPHRLGKHFCLKERRSYSPRKQASEQFYLNFALAAKSSIKNKMLEFRFS